MMTTILPAANTGFASGGVTCLVNIDERALCIYSSSVLVDPARAGLRNPPERKARNRQSV